MKMQSEYESSSKPLSGVPAEASSNALKAWYGLSRVWLYELITEKDYTCWQCAQPVEGGYPHVFFRFLFKHPGTNFDHHHIHHDCAARLLEKELTGVEVIKYSQIPLKKRGRPRKVPKKESGGS